MNKLYKASRTLSNEVLKELQKFTDTSKVFKLHQMVYRVSLKSLCIYKVEVLAVGDELYATAEVVLKNERFQKVNLTNNKYLFRTLKEAKDCILNNEEFEHKVKWEKFGDNYWQISRY